jgi:hypothetical protein
VDDAQSRFADPLEMSDAADDKTTFYSLLESTEDGEVAVELEEQDEWPERPKRPERFVGEDRRTKVGIEVLMRPEVRPDIIALGVAHGMAGQKFIEHLIVNAINDNPDLVIKGEKIIKRAKGNIRHAIALARDEQPSRFQDRIQSDRPSFRNR